MAKFNNSTPAHPLLSGFPLEFALRHVANNPISSDHAKNLAVAVLKGHTEGLWGLHDELQETNHPILKAGYKWLNAADKLHLDKHTYTALNEAAERHRASQPHAEHRIDSSRYQWHYTTERQAQLAIQGLNAHPGSVLGQHYQNVVDRVKQLSPHSQNEDVRESLRRHAHRALMESSRRVTGTSPDNVVNGEGRSIRPTGENREGRTGGSIQNEEATRYKAKPKAIKYSLANKSNFVGALLKASSPEHKMFVSRTKQLAHKMGAQQTKEFPALHDTPNQSVPGVAMAVYGNIQPDAVHALGSWVNGLLPNGPGYAVFHARPTGPDTLYRIRMEGSGYDARMKLDRAGISSRIFVPHKKGLDVLVPDKGNQMGQAVQQFASQQKVAVESSPGHLTTVGSQDQGQARDTFRNKVVAHESKQPVAQMSRHGRPLTYAITVNAPWKSRPKPKVNQPEVTTTTTPNTGPYSEFTHTGDKMPGHLRESVEKNIHENNLKLLGHTGNKTNKVPTKRPTPPPLPAWYAPPYNIQRQAESNLKGEQPQSSAKEVAYQPGMQPPTNKLPKGVKTKQWTPSTPDPKANELPKGKPVFSTSEYNKLDKWAHDHALKHSKAFAEFLGVHPTNPDMYKFLVNAIKEAAHHTRRTGMGSATIGIGKTGKRIKINIPNRGSWNNVNLGGKTYKLPKRSEPLVPTGKLSRYERRRMVYRSIVNACR